MEEVLIALLAFGGVVTIGVAAIVIVWALYGILK